MTKPLTIPFLFCFLLYSCAHKKTDGKTTFLIEKKYKTALTYLNKGISEPAQKELLDAIEIAPNDARLHIALGQSYLIGKKFNAAFSALDKAIALDPKLAEAYFYKGDLYMLLKKWDDAIAEYNHVLKFPFFNAPHNLYNSIGLAYYEKGMYSQAIESFKKAIEFRFDFPIVHYNMGLTYLQTGDIDSAITEYTNAIEFLPDYVDAYNQLGLIYLKKGDKENAKKKFARVITLAPKSPLAQEAKKYLALIE